MSEKQQQQQVYTPVPANGGWHPSHTPADNQPLNTFAPAPAYGTAPMQPTPTQDVKALPPLERGHSGQPGQPGQPGQIAPGQAGQMASLQVCPVTGGSHVEKRRPGVIGLIIGICFCPLGCIAIIFDQERKCRECGYVMEEAWGGC
ncbi:hypothetical protein CC85DRAFT_312319 [Cutaneotrichosporon oleaginosum]|uniref:Brain protein I3 n=1 Tax=Cutaneotrichosporon oleaginosum TaxID=879819 RepID=A0A0J0XMF6_9TREE|nr:uncharacterized protein CC85DRAFT_312319 [Cutaneotrichosporon oleaginosum]KLT42248.1 hypothetical protein CC85DRAFT_312319 [Cutaneotrichosporon oleaginosum]TXT11421.1 hypothetical protein COLE_01831 [Cutaneotrichosporon oleaginosum]